MNEDSQNEVVDDDSDLATHIYKDEENLNAAILLILIGSGLLAIIIILVGWLYFDRLWLSISIGLVTLVVITLVGTMKLQSGKEEYDALVEEFQQDAEEMGISTEQAQKMMDTFVNVMDRVEKNSNK